MGSIASFIFSMAPSVGASGAIFGLLGALIYYGIEHPALFKRGFGKSILMTLVLNIVYGFSVPRIDNFGHFGGLIGGFLASGVVGTPFSRRSLKKRTAFTAVMAVLLSISLYCGFTNSQNRLLEKCKLIRHFYDEQNWQSAKLLVRK
ncbi:rhomboid family protein [Acetivibrio straminisolvens JCM 21531]|uniref:Rhomboid family protein n=1 Tax=Acetivibrio straminisolvens JCM 21531 TaxID=1294263 RepID=W4V3S4_9FIRM|nr:rhomboid family protein [Acetivibrio straminisolvens JCM 21531]